MESFYGGRQGISFIIKKSFNSIYATFDYMKCLCDNKGNLAIDIDNNLIEYDEVQHSQFNYKNIELNGEFPPHRQAISFIDNIFGEEIIQDTSKINVPFIKNEENGMVNCFKEGGKTTNIVNYGEYVIIDTVNKSNPDNGKVFRRGLDFNNELGGAEYIGQIVGPQGKCPAVHVDAFKNVMNLIGNTEILDENESIDIPVFPGKFIDNNGDEQYNDKIHVAFVNFVDNVNNETLCKIGFKIPYPFLEIQPNVVELSYIENGKIELTNSLEEHPFYYNWELSIPQGTPGDKIQVFFDEEYTRENAQYYRDKECTQAVDKLGEGKTVQIIYEEYAENDLPDIIGRPIKLPTKSNDIFYVKKQDRPTEKVIMIAKVNTFDRDRDKNDKGTFFYRIIGQINTINSVNLDINNGNLVIDQTYIDDYKTQLDWVKDITLNPENGKLVIIHTKDQSNTTQYLDWVKDVEFQENGEIFIHHTAPEDNQIRQSDFIAKIIKDVQLDKENGNLIVTYNTNIKDPEKNDTYENQLTWVKDVQFNQDGTITLHKTTSSNNSDFIVKIIDEVALDNNNGKFTITYNTIDKDTHQKEQFIADLPWVKDVSMNEKGQVSIHKTIDNNENGTVINADNPIKWIKEVNFSNDGKFTVDFNDETSYSKPTNIQWIESTKIVDEASYLTLVQKGFDINTIPSIGSVIVKYNTNTIDNLSQYFYLWNGEYQKVWTKIGEAQELTGLKIFKTEENGFDKIKDYATSIPAGWGVFIPAKKKSETEEYSKAYIVIKNGYGSGYNNPDNWPKIYIEDLGIANSPESISPTNYATGVQNLEQELLFEKDTYIEEYNDNEGNKIVETHYCNETTLYTEGSKYYKIKTIIYRDDKIKSSIRVENNILISLSIDKWTKYFESNKTLSLTSGGPRGYNINGNTLTMSSGGKLIKEDILYVVTVGSDTEPKEIMKKKTVELVFTNGKKIIKEENTII